MTSDADRECDRLRKRAMRKGYRLQTRSDPAGYRYSLIDELDGPVLDGVTASQIDACLAKIATNGKA
jgi:hypothetical protein